MTLDELDLDIHFVKENFVLSDDSRSTEKFMHGIKVLMAQELHRQPLARKPARGCWRRPHRAAGPPGRRSGT